MNVSQDDSKSSNIIVNTKSLFERAIIESTKEIEEVSITNKLNIALDEIKFYIKDIYDNHQRNTNEERQYILNLNILDKIARLLERKLFYVKIVVARILDQLIEENYINLLTNNVEYLIRFTNEILNLLDDIRTTEVSYSLEKKLLYVLNHFKNIKIIDYEQQSIINELTQNYQKRNSESEEQQAELVNIINLCKSEESNSKMRGVNLLIEFFSECKSLNMQFHFLSNYINNIVKSLLNSPKSEYTNAYFQFGHFLVSMLFNINYRFDAGLESYNLNSNNLSDNTIFVVYDDVLLNNSQSDIVKQFESTYELKNASKLLLNCEELYRIAFNYVSILINFEESFDMQYVCYVVLKRLYFLFPHKRSNMEKILIDVLIILCKFTEQIQVNDSQECRHFIQFLLSTESNSFIQKLKNRITSTNTSVEADVPASINERKNISF